MKQQFPDISHQGAKFPRERANKGNAVASAYCWGRGVQRGPRIEHRSGDPGRPRRLEFPEQRTERRGLHRKSSGDPQPLAELDPETLGQSIYSTEISTRQIREDLILTI